MRDNCELSGGDHVCVHDWGRSVGDPIILGPVGDVATLGPVIRLSSGAIHTHGWARRSGVLTLGSCWGG